MPHSIVLLATSKYFIVVAIALSVLSFVVALLALRQEQRLAKRLRLIELVSFSFGLSALVLFSTEFGSLNEQLAHREIRSNAASLGYWIREQVTGVYLSECGRAAPAAGEGSTTCVNLSKWLADDTNIALVPKLPKIDTAYETINRDIDRYEKLRSEIESHDLWREISEGLFRNSVTEIAVRGVIGICLAIAAGLGAARRLVEYLKT